MLAVLSSCATTASLSIAASSTMVARTLTSKCPGIYFADEPAGRVAKVAGTGLGVWEVIRDYTAAKGDERKLRKWLPHLSTAQLKAATVYYARFPQEIDAEIGDDSAAHAEGWAMQKTIARHA
jgi:uncharacterized protein (DUF433 family)